MVNILMGKKESTCQPKKNGLVLPDNRWGTPTKERQKTGGLRRKYHFAGGITKKRG